MTDHIPADKVREIIEKMRDHANHNNVRGSEEEYVRFFASQLDALLPPPSLPTLADMTPEARRDCQWMQADTKPWGRVVIIVPDLSDGRAALLDIWGDVDYEDHEQITPRPDLPRLTWPGDQEPEDVTPAEVGDVIESADDPRIDALPAGSILLDRDEEAATKRPGAWTGLGNKPIASERDEFGPWTVLHIPKKADQ